MKKLMILLAILSASCLSPLQARDLAVGDVPPQILGRTLDGERIDLADYKGRIVIITFWATWCPPCMKEVPILNEIQKQVPKEKLVVFAMNYQQNRRTVRKYKEHLEEYFQEVKLTLLYEKGKKVSTKYGVDRIPFMFVLNREGTIENIHIGYSEEEIPKFAAEINALLLAPTSETE